MLKTCQSFFPADNICPPVVFLHSHYADSKSSRSLKLQIFTLDQSSLVKGIAFFLPFFNTCKVDTYFQKTKMMLYEKM